ncbi:hypothetical protein BASA81_006854 [Batrachochytrium salamandrivorans]|nr:hypothetical protein BASA81_006854 [Batrachochytrium salamandrivorans]
MSHLPYARDTSTHSFAEELFSLSPVVGGRLHPQVSCSNFELDETDPTPKPHHNHAHKFSLRTFFSFIGPGLLSSAAFVDPGNIESDLQAGAYAGYQLLWVVAMATLVGFLFQSLAIRLGTVSGRDLATNCKLAFPQHRVRLLWAMTQIAIVASDIQEIVGSAVAFRLLFGFPLWLGCLLTGLDTITFLGLQATGLRKLEAVFGVCLFTLVVCFFGNFAVSQPSGELIAEGMVPTSMNHRVFIQAAGILGAIIMPHNIFLHSALVLSRDVDRTSPSSVKEANFYYTLESSLTLLMTFFVNAAIVSVFAHGFYSSTCAGISTTIDGMEPPFACVEAGDLSLTTSQYCALDSTGRAGTCQPIGLQVAGEPLEKLLGSSARIMWAVGLLAAGQTSTVTGTYAGQFVMEGMLELHLPNWQRVAFTRSVSLIPALFVALVAANDHFAADRLDAWLNVVQMVQLPFALVPLLALCSSAQVMGNEFRLSNTEKRVGWALTGLVVLANAFLLHTMVGNAKWVMACGMGLVVVYVAVLVGFVNPQLAITTLPTLLEEVPLVSSSHNHYST